MVEAPVFGRGVPVSGMLTVLPEFVTAPVGVFLLYVDQLATSTTIAINRVAVPPASR